MRASQRSLSWQSRPTLLLHVCCLPSTAVLVLRERELPLHARVIHAPALEYLASVRDKRWSWLGLGATMSLVFVEAGTHAAREVSKSCPSGRVRDRVEESNLGWDFGSPVVHNFFLHQMGPELSRGRMTAETRRPCELPTIVSWTGSPPGEARLWPNSLLGAPAAYCVASQTARNTFLSSISSPPCWLPFLLFPEKGILGNTEGHQFYFVLEA